MGRCYAFRLLAGFRYALSLLLEAFQQYRQNYHKCLKYALNQAVLEGTMNRSPYLGFKL